MFRRRSGLALSLGIALGVALASLPARAASVTLQGTIGTDDAIQLFNVTVATAGVVDIRSYGYGGGTASTGTVVPRGGFDTILTLFGASGAFIDDNDDGAGAAVDPITGQAADARITANLAAGSYILALTQYDNFSIGNLANGFGETGHPNFTTDPGFGSGGACPGNMFRDISGTAGRCRTGNWALDFVNVASASPTAPVPEPGTAALLCLSLLGLAWIVRKRKPYRLKLLSVLLPGFFFGAWNADAQQSNNPDYTSLTDVLNGKRSVLPDDDIVYTLFNPNGTAPSSGTVVETVLTTKNGDLVPEQPVIPSAPLNIGDDRIHKVFAGLFYQSEHDLLLRAVPAAGGTPSLLLTDRITTIANPALPGGANGDVMFSGAMGDFNGDGYADFAVNFGPGDETGKMVVFSGANRDGSQNLHFGPVNTQETLLAMTAGDFDGDGVMEIAGFAYKRTGRYVLIIYKVDPATLTISKAAELLPSYAGENPSQPISYFSMAGGHFTSATHSQVALSYATTTGTVKIAVYDFAGGSLQPIEKSVYSTSSAFANAGGNIQVEAGKFSLANPFDQLFFGFAWNGPGGTAGDGTKLFAIFEVDSSNETLALKTRFDISDLDYVSSFALGNYDKKTTDSTGRVVPAFGLQVAIANNWGGNILQLNVYPINPADYSTYLEGLYGVGKIPSNPATVVAVTSADVQGRSYLLGEPAKVVLNGSTQPSVVLAMPPMHVDWVAPVNSTTPEVLNVSAAPHGFKTFYDVDTSKADESDTSDTTSFSFGAKQTVGGSFSIGNVDAGDGLQVKDVYTVAQDLKSSIQSDSGTSHQESYKLSASTVFGDYVLYTESRFNVWVYPVIGKTVCPATKPNCQPGEKVPLTLQFSIPDQTTSTFGSGKDMEWYQPPWEPLNIFSYPANLKQLQTIYPNTQQINSTTAAFTDQSQITQQVTWVNGSSTSQTAGFDLNNSYENDMSVNAAISFGEVGFGFEGSLDISGSQGFSALNKSVTSYSSSTGIGVSYLGSVIDPTNYRYAFAPVIFGNTPPTGAVDKSPLNTDVKAYGLIRTAFTADPASSSAGGWWRQAYSLPDVALNRPAHWVLSTPGEGGVNCLANGSGGSQFDCFSLGTNNPQDPWTSEVHLMRGFFISNAAYPGQGPQLTMATAGDQLTLQARVYNYSFQSMPVNTIVHVQFYAQPIDGSNLPSGSSISIGEDKLASIPPFDSTDGAPLNWTLASVNFDTTPYGGKTVAFWVVVWMEGADGTMVKEMLGHGLKGVPSGLTSLADVLTEDYSNNVGFYKMAFPIIAHSPSLIGASPSSRPVPVDIGKIGLSATQATLNQPIKVSAPLAAPSAPVQGVTAQFYDGDPKNGGALFDIERLSYLEPNEARDATTIYRASSCGTHELFVVVNKNLPNEVVRRAHPVRVDCKRF